MIIIYIGVRYSVFLLSIYRKKFAKQMLWYIDNNPRSSHRNCFLKEYSDEALSKRSNKEFSEETHIWKTNNFWNEMTEPNFSFSISDGLSFLFLSNHEPPSLHFIFGWKIYDTNNEQISRIFEFKFWKLLETWTEMTLFIKDTLKPYFY